MTTHLRTVLVGIVNVTPDSFSGDGIYRWPEGAADLAERLVEAGADVIDVGGESTRPGHARVPQEEELERVVPAIRAIRRRTSVPISIDTSKAGVALEAMKSGATIVNDVSGLSDPNMAATVASKDAGLILVSNASPSKGQDVVEAMAHDLGVQLDRAVADGVRPDGIAIDPGLGFGKTWRQNLEVVRRLRELKAVGRPILVGPSRKGTIGKVLGSDLVHGPEATLALACVCCANGADLIRVHDVGAVRPAVTMIDALLGAAL